MSFEVQMSMKTFMAFWLAAAMLLTTPATGQEGVDEASESERAEELVPETSFDIISGPTKDSPGRIQRAEQTVRAVQGEGGIYAIALSDALVELGMAYREAGEHDKAVTAFFEALQVARINHGLHDLEQIPYVYHIIEENLLLGRWDDVDASYNYLYGIHKRNYGDRDPRLLPVIEKLALAKLSIEKAMPGALTATHLQQNLDLLDDAVDIVELHYSDDIDRMAEVLYLVARSNYEIARQTGRLNQRGLQQRSPRTRSAFSHEAVDQVSNLVARTQRNGSNVLERIEKLYENHAASRLFPRALAVAHQGDWQQLYHRGSGRRYYTRAYQLLKGLEDGQQHIDRLFGKPRLLPAMESKQDDDLPDSTAPNPDGFIVELALDVSVSGHPRNIDTLSVPAHLAHEAPKLRRHAETWRFRPRMVDGHAIETPVVQPLLITHDGSVILLETQPERPGLAKAED